MHTDTCAYTHSLVHMIHTHDKYERCASTHKTAHKPAHRRRCSESEFYLKFMSNPFRSNSLPARSCTSGRISNFILSLGSVQILKLKFQIDELFETLCEEKSYLPSCRPGKTVYNSLLCYPVGWNRHDSHKFWTLRILPLAQQINIYLFKFKLHIILLN